MAGTTPIYGFPYPEPTDLVADYPALGQQLAEDVEDTIAAIPMGGMTLITSGSLTGASVTMSSIPGTYKDLRIIVRNYLPATDGTELKIRVNGVTSASYNSGTNPNATSAFDATWATVSPGNDNASAYGLFDIKIPDYANTVTWKIFDVIAVSTNYTTPAQYSYQRIIGAHNITSAISSITIQPGTGNFTSGNFFLYGVS